jgi:KDO2-lipid IV(A) lauroyltransferase
MDRSVSALGANLFDALAARRLLDAGLVTGPEHGEQLVPLLERLAGPGRGVLVLTGHLGCWELLGGWLARQVEAAGLGTLAVVTGTLHNPPVDRVVQERRRALGLKPLPREEGARPLVAHLKAGQVAAILLDQNTSARSLAVPFFGRPARTATGLAQMALKYGIPVLPVAIARYGKGHRVVWLDPLLPDPAGGTGDRADLERFLIRCNRSLETLIRRNPAEWVWFHRRWEAAAETGPSAGTGADPNGS